MIDRKRVRELAAAEEATTPPVKATKKRPVRPWREPYAVLLAFAESPSAEERERRRAGVPAALRKLRRSLYTRKKAACGVDCWNGTTQFRDPAVDTPLMILLHNVVSNPVLDDETREHLCQAINRIIDHKH
jgi:hypothetical protein